MPIVIFLIGIVPWGDVTTLKFARAGKACCGSSANAFTQLRSCVGCTFRSCDA